MGMQNKVKYMKKLFQNPNIYKKKKSSNETSSPNIILLRQNSNISKHELRFISPLRETETDLYTQRYPDISCAER